MPSFSWLSLGVLQEYGKLMEGDMLQGNELRLVEWVGTEGEGAGVGRLGRGQSHLQAGQCVGWDLERPQRLSSPMAGTMRTPV